ncbi:hypothetical protein [Flavobacterium laiguense]|jgi:hypothetical protein|uniref:Uncharacterized protein n=1 Tax=Flavobacterium laiguense TaxID=2169409 RepID=A0A2U1JJC7_9FLAO|nr:hypothetical protein [Flavobacterium laiguense]PWA05280.1 hypothetical protein DB891_17195 [Flavobacterium laiguense]
MKSVLKTFAILFLFANNSCKAQQMVQTPNDVYKLKANEQQFINKPLKNLLKEIKPEIKIAFGTLGYPSFFSFRFISREEMNRKPFGSNTLGLFVYVKEPVDEWDNSKRPKEIEFQWTKEDVEKYGDFTVIRIKVIGKD